MGKVKVVSKNNQVSVKVKSTKGEQLNQNMAELLSKTEVEGFLPFYITSDGSSFSAEYGIAGYETAKEFFKNRVIVHILNFDFILAQQLKNNIQRPLKILQNVGFGMDDALQTVLWFSHSGFLC